MALVQRFRSSRASWIDAAAIVAALGVGLALTRLPLLPLAAALVGGAVIFAILVEPLIGLGLTLLAAPFSALERFQWGLPLDSSQVLLALTLGAWLLRGLARRQVRFCFAPLLAPLLIFTGVAALSLWNALSLTAGLRELLKWLQIIAVYLFVVESINRNRLPWLIGMTLAAALVQAGLGIWQFGLSDWGPEHFAIAGTPFYRAFGTFHQPNPFAGYMGLALPLVVGIVISNFKSEISNLKFHLLFPASCFLPPASCFFSPASCFLLFPCALLLAGGLVASWSRGAWLGAAAAMAVMAAFWPRRWWLGVGVVSVLVVLVVGGNALGMLPSVVRDRLADLTQYAQFYDVRGVGVNDANYAVIERLAHWQAAVDMIRWNLWTGVGWGNYEAAYPSFHLLNWPYALGHAHNFLLNITAETGLPGLLAYLGMWAAIFWQTLRALSRTSGWQRGLALGVLGVWVHLHVHNLFDNLYVSNLWIHLGVLLGMLAIIEQAKDK